MRSDDETDDSSGFIEGVYNYCDRWCERCPLTARCRLFAMEAEFEAAAESRDPENAAFWEALGLTFEQADGEDAFEFELDEAELEEIGRQQDELERQTEEHPLFVAAHDYAMQVKAWFAARRPRFPESGPAAFEQPGCDQAAPGRRSEAVRLSDAVDVIHWYCFQIGAKSARALSTVLEEGPYASDEDLYDANGSAKVALLGIERSLAAWMLLSRMVPEEKASIRAHVARLQRLRLQLGDLFPNARAFIRPGFDTPAE